MRKFLAAMAMLFVTVLAIWVAFRLAPETWAMVAGIVFGLIATLPMCAIVLVMLLRNHSQDRRPAEPTYYAPPQPQQPMIMLNAEPGPYGQYWVEAPRAARPLPPGAAYPVRRPTPAPSLPVGRPFVDRSQGMQGYAPAAMRPAPRQQEWAAEDDGYYEDAPEGYDTWERPAPSTGGARILGW